MVDIDIKADDGRVQIHILGYERDEGSDESDNNWLSSFVEIDIPPFKGGFTAAFQIDELVRLTGNLESLYDDIGGVCVFTPVEGALSLKFAMKVRGNLVISGEAKPSPFSSEPALRFVLHSDQTVLKSVIGGLKAIARQYPFRSVSAT